MPTPTIFSYSLEDEYGVPASAHIYVAYDASTETVSALLGAAAAFGGLLDAVTGLLIKEFNVIINALPDPGWKSAAVAGTDPEQTLLENFSIEDSKYVYSFDLPGLRNSLIDSSGRPIIATGAIDALNDAIVGSVGTGVFANNEFLIDLTGLVDASITFRKLSRKKRKAVSTVTP